MTKPLLELRGVHSGYNEIPVISDIKLSVYSGQIVALLGANGAGKSTMLKTISGLLRVSKGEIFFDGGPINHSSPEKIVSKGIIHVPEGRGIFPDFTVRENLIIGTYLRRDRSKISNDIEKIFNIFPTLSNRMRQRAGTLSGGEQQMLALARGLIAKPKVLMIDEPSLGLAPIVVQKIFKVIAQLAEDGMTVLLVEQNSRAALWVANYGYIVLNGKIVYHGKAEIIARNKNIDHLLLGVSKDADLEL